MYLYKIITIKNNKLFIFILTYNVKLMRNYDFVISSM